MGFAAHGKHVRRTHTVQIKEGIFKVVTVNRTQRGNLVGFYATVQPPKNLKGAEPSKYHVNTLDRLTAATQAAVWYATGKVGQERRAGILYRTPKYGNVNDQDLEIGTVVRIVGGEGYGFDGAVVSWDDDGHVMVKVDPSNHPEPIKCLHYDLERWTDEELAEASDPGPGAFGYWPGEDAKPQRGQG